VTKPDVVAPGVQVFSCIPPEKTAEGTFQYTYYGRDFDGDAARRRRRRPLDAGEAAGIIKASASRAK
jgi:hypothetical protein